MTDSSGSGIADAAQSVPLPSSEVAQPMTPAPALPAVALLRRVALAGGLALAALAVPVPAIAGLAMAADPTPTPVVTAAPDPTPAPTPSTAPTPDPTATPDPTPAPTAIPSPTPDPSPTPTPSDPPPPPTAPSALNLYVPTLFRYQDPNYTACTATSAMVMLNFIAAAGSGGESFRWHPSRSSTLRDSILAYERAHDTLAATSRGSDPHGWRNALNYYGWGSPSLMAGDMIYDDVSFSSYATAMHTAVRQIILTHKPVGLLGWAGHHAQMLTGYFGLVGDPFATNPDGSWANTFTVAGFYISDPLRSDYIVNLRVTYSGLATTANLHLRFRSYLQTDSPYDDRYTPGYRISRTEWYRRFTLLLPQR